LAFAPDFQGNLSVRKEWGMPSGNTGHLQAQVVRSNASFSDIMEPNKAKQNAYHYFNIRTGRSNDDWTAELYLDNVFDKRGHISNTFVFDKSRISVIKPRTFGVRYKKSF
jgi:hypothetical protein